MFSTRVAENFRSLSSSLSLSLSLSDTFLLFEWIGSFWFSRKEKRESFSHDQSALNEKGANAGRKGVHQIYNPTPLAVNRAFGTLLCKTILNESITGLLLVLLQGPGSIINVSDRDLGSSNPGLNGQSLHFFLRFGWKFLVDEIIMHCFIMYKIHILFPSILLTINNHSRNQSKRQCQSQKNHYNYRFGDAESGPFLDATPNTLPFADRVRSIYEAAGGNQVNEVKFIVILRDPVARELSFYNHMTRLCREGKSSGWWDDVRNPDGSIKSFDEFVNNVTIPQLE